ncbi:MAG: enhanced serine sensitivity protein SseB [Lachnospiraceae bacterium]|nr:enhanced serine sensitivity protein SseB [Lachnospiraceae bacterium]
MDKIKLINSREVVEAIDKMRKNNNAQTQGAAIALITQAKYLAPVTLDPPMPKSEKTTNALVQLPPETKVRFHMIENDKQERFFLAFTSYEELAKWNSDDSVNAVIVTFDDIANMILKGYDDDKMKGFVIDPFGSNMVLSKEFALAIKKQKDEFDAARSPHAIKEGERVYIGEPADYPTELVKALKEYLPELKDISKAYLQLMCQGERESFLIILDHKGDKKALYEAVAAAAKPFLGGKILDIIDTENPMGLKVTENAKPFYEA